MIPPKETSNTPITDLKEIEIYKSLEEEFKIFVLKWHNALQEHRQLSEIRKILHEQNENNKEKKL